MVKKKKICFLGYGEPSGELVGNGVVRVIKLQAKILRDRGYDVCFFHLFSIKEYKELNQFLIKNEIDLALWHMTSLKIKWWLHTPCPLVCLWHSTPNFTYENYASIFCKKYKVNSFVRNIFQSGFVNFFLIKMHALYNASMFVYVTACSDRMVLLSNKFIPRFVAAKFFPNKVLSISNMIESNGLKCFEKKKEVLFVGRLDNKTKKIDLLLHIWSKIESVAEDWILNICGDGKDRQMLEQMCKDLNLQHVYFRGFVMPEDFYKTASVFCVTSAFEGWGLVIEEAASYGCVPLAFNSFEAVTDLITDGENGILIPPFDIDAYANAIKRLMNDEQERNRLAQNAQRDVVRFEPEIIMDQWENLFESVFNKR